MNVDPFYAAVAVALVLALALTATSDDHPTWLDKLLRRNKDDWDRP